MRIKNSERGTTIAMALFIALVLSIMIMSMARSFALRSHQSVYYSNMKRAQRVAERGLHNAIGDIIRATGPQPFGSGDVTEDNAHYEYYDSIRTHPTTCYYILTTATITLNGHDYISRLYNYVKISNIGEYLFAINGSLSISTGIQAPNAKVFATKLYFSHTGSNTNSWDQTQLKGAEYTESVDPSVREYSDPELDEPIDPAWKTELIVNPEFGLNDGARPFDVPRHLLEGIIFPQVFPDDLNRWQALGEDASHTDFSTMDTIAPPGSPADHIYFSADDIHIGNPTKDTTIIGQVLFVSAKNIYIDGNIRHGTSQTLPGDSTAHQLVLIANQNVYIASTCAAGETRTIEALIYAPNGGLIPLHYQNDLGQVLDYSLSMEFKGSCILSKLSGDNSDDRFPSVFRVNRSFMFDDTYSLHRPPYLPAITEILYTFYEPPQGSGLDMGPGH